MTKLLIPLRLPAHTRAYLAYLDAALIERSLEEGVSPLDLARGMVDRARGEQHHMLHVYIQVAERQEEMLHA